MFTLIVRKGSKTLKETLRTMGISHTIKNNPRQHLIPC